MGDRPIQPRPTSDYQPLLTEDALSNDNPQNHLNDSRQDANRRQETNESKDENASSCLDQPDA